MRGTMERRDEGGGRLGYERDLGERDEGPPTRGTLERGMRVGEDWDMRRIIEERDGGAGRAENRSMWW